MTIKYVELNTTRRFGDQMVSAHHLLKMAKDGKKGNLEGQQYRYALPAFNVTNHMGIDAAFEAFESLGSSGLLAFSNSALKHFGHGDSITGLEAASEYVQFRAKRSKIKVATHLDHGDYIGEAGRKVLQAAVYHLTSVMADNSTDHATKQATSLQENIDATREVVEMAHPLGVSVEGELGVLAGVEDEETFSENSTYTDPAELEAFLRETGVLLLAPTIGTMHGPNKGKPGDVVKLNIELANECLKIADKINPDICFVAHGASTLYPEVVNYALEQLKSLGPVGEEGIAKWSQFVGTDWNQIKGLIENGFSKINTDTENRQTYLAAMLGAIAKDSSKIDIRYYEKVAYKALVKSYQQKLIMSGNTGVWYEPRINVDQFSFDLNA
jgi:fructose-bisphosphate aldolase class II